jgi:hypothetical protein
MQTKTFEHRHESINISINQLADIFTINNCAYTVISALILSPIPIWLSYIKAFNAAREDDNPSTGE